MPGPDVTTFVVTEHLRTGASVTGGGEEFRWSSDEHSSPIGDVPMPLIVATKDDTLVGTETPVQQVLHSTLGPVEFQGVWKDRYMGAGQAFETWKRFEAMVRRANLVSVEIRDVKMVGLITNFTPVLSRRGEIPWTFTLRPHSHGGTLAGTLARWGRSVVRGIQSLLDVPASPKERRAQAAAIHADAVELHGAAPRNATGGDDWATTDSALSDMGDAVSKLDSVANDLALNEARASVQSFRREAGVHRRLRNRAVQLVDDTAALRADLGKAYDDSVVELLHDEWIRGLRLHARRTVLNSAQAEDDLARRAQQRPIARHLARKGESVYEISTTYYGTPDLWRQIHDANDLTLMRFEGGEELLIPEVTGA